MPHHQKNVLGEYLHLNSIMSAEVNLWQQFQFSCRTINLESRENGIDTSSHLEM